jgi:hypothetical protein
MEIEFRFSLVDLKRAFRRLLADCQTSLRQVAISSFSAPVVTVWTSLWEEHPKS